MPSTSLIAELRRRVGDVRHVRTALTISTTDAAVTAAVLEVTHGRLVFTPAGGTVLPLDLDLAAPAYDSVGKLHAQLSRFPGLAVRLHQDADGDHLSLDLEEFGPVDIRTQGVDLRTRYFSDWELEQVLAGAVRRHNPTFTSATVPDAERELVLMLAQATVNRQKATDAIRRKGTDSETQVLLSIADSFERAYREDAERLRRVIQPPREAPEGRIQQGDVLVGSTWRRSLRTGRLTPVGAAPPPPPPLLFEPGDGDAEDDNVRLSWQRSEDPHFYAYELWRDVQPQVHRRRDGNLPSGVPAGGNDAIRASSSTLVLYSPGPSGGRWAGIYAGFVERQGQMVASFAAPDLEPETDYYFRLYVVDVNGAAVASQVVHARTRPLRVRFDPLASVSATVAAVGQTLTVNFDPTKGPFTAASVSSPGCELRLGDKVVAATIVTPYQVTFVVPSFTQTAAPKDLVVTSPTGLQDVKSQVVTVTP